MRMDSYAGLDINSLSDRSGVEGLVLVAFLTIVIALAVIFSAFFAIAAVIFAIYFRKALFIIIKEFLFQEITWRKVKDFLILILWEIPLFLLENLEVIILSIWYTIIFSIGAWFVYGMFSKLILPTFFPEYFSA